MPSSISRQVHSSIVPARRSAQYFQTSVPRAERLAAPVAAQHRPGGHEDRRDVRARGAHQQRRHGLVAAAEQDGAVGGIGAQRFLRLHRQQVAIEHRRRLHEGLAQRQQRDLHREAARLPHTALDVVGAQAEMRVARVRVAPGVEDGDDGLARHVVGVKPGLPRARAMAGRSQDRPCRTSDGCAARWVFCAGGSRVALPQAVARPARARRAAPARAARRTEESARAGARPASSVA